MPELCLEDVEIIALRKRTRMWVAGLIIMTAIWLGLLIGLAVDYSPYIKNCEPNNSFGKYAIVVAVYVILQNFVDIMMAIKCLKSISIYLNADVINKWQLCLAKSEKKCLNNDQFSEGYKLLTNEEIPVEKIPAIMKIASRVRRRRVEDVFLNEYTAKGIGKQGVNSAQLNAAFSHIPKWPSKQRITLSSTPRASKILFGTASVPVLCILFFIIAGSDAVAEIRQTIGNKEDDLPVVCRNIITLSWVTLICSLLVNIIRAIPMAIAFCFHRGGGFDNSTGSHQLEIASDVIPA